MKTFFKVLGGVILLAAIGLCLMYQCSKTIDETIDEIQNVDNYDVYIEDVVRYTLASADPKFAYIDSENAELQSKTDRKIESIALGIDDDRPSYKVALTEVINTGNLYERTYAADLLNIYNNLNIALTPFEEDANISGKYYFQEKNSRIHFTVSVGIMCYCTGDTWDINRYTEYLETGYFRSNPTEELEDFGSELGDVIDEEFVYDEDEEQDYYSTMSEITN